MDGHGQLDTEVRSARGGGLGGVLAAWLGGHLLPDLGVSVEPALGAAAMDERLWPACAPGGRRRSSGTARGTVSTSAQEACRSTITARGRRAGTRVRTAPSAGPGRP